MNSIVKSARSAPRSILAFGVGLLTVLVLCSLWADTYLGSWGKDPEILKHVNDHVKTYPKDDIAPEVEPAPRFIFAFGDSYTATGFDIFKELPSRHNPFGNPPFPGHSSAVGPNWIDNLILGAPENTICWNFATGAAVVDIDIVRPPLSLIPYPFQVENFTKALGTPPNYAPWTARNSLATIWLGVNDVAAIQVYTDKSSWSVLVDRIMISLFNRTSLLYEAGLRQFVFMGVPPLYHLPFALSPGYKSIDNLTLTCKYWDEKLAENVNRFMHDHTGVQAEVLLTAPYYDEAVKNYEAHGAPDATCKNKDGVSCLWVDSLHGGVEIARLVGDVMLDLLVGKGFLESKSYRTAVPSTWAGRIDLVE